MRQCHETGSAPVRAALTGCMFLTAALMSSVRAVDGIAVSYRSENTHPFGHHTGSIVRHVVRSDTVESDSVVYGEGDARCVRLSPDGTRVAFVRASDGSICIMDVDGGPVRAVQTVGPNAVIDWPANEFIYHTIMFNHVTMKRLDVAAGQSSNVGFFPTGVTYMTVSADPDSFRGTVTLDSAGWHELKTIDYNDTRWVWIIDHLQGCHGHISPSGSFYSVAVCDYDSSLYHRLLKLYTWEGVDTGMVSAPPGEYITRGKWSVNSDSWMVFSVGAGPELLQYHDMMLVSRETQSTIRVTANDSGAYSEGCDFWVGDPDAAMAQVAARPHSGRRGQPGRPLRASLSGGMLRVSGLSGGVTLVLLTPEGRVARRHGPRAAMAGLDIRGLGSGVYVLVVERAGIVCARAGIVLNPVGRSAPGLERVLD